MQTIHISKETQKALTALGVVALYLFGSRAQGRAGPLSDYDFAVLLKDSTLFRSSKKKEALYDGLYRLLSPLCPREFPNDILDIVFLQRVSLELQMHVVRHGCVLFDTDPQLRSDFEASIMLRAADFAPLRHFMSTMLLARL